MKKAIHLVLVVSIAAVLGACASSSPDVIKRGDAQRMAQVEDGVVLSIRTVVVEGSQSGIGATVGGVVGAIGGYGGSGVQREAQVLGVLAGVEIESLRFALSAIAPHTLLAGVSIEIDQPPGNAWCLPCGRNVEITSRLDACPHCGGFQLQPTGGTELRVVDMQVE